MRQRKDFQRIEGVKSSRLIVIAAEGRATENIYFEAMRQELYVQLMYSWLFLTEKMITLIQPMFIVRLRISWMNTTSWTMINYGL